MSPRSLPFALLLTLGMLQWACMTPLSSADGEISPAREAQVDFEDAPSLDPGFPEVGSGGNAPAAGGGGVATGGSSPDSPGEEDALDPATPPSETGGAGGTEEDPEPPIPPVTDPSEQSIDGDPITYDAFEGYGTTELEIMRAHESWTAIERARVHSYSFPGLPQLALPEGRVVRAAVPESADLPTNVRRIIAVMDEDDWDELTPVRDARYTYRDFLTAAAKWPRFCAEKNGTAPHLADFTLEEVCALELANVLAHFAQEVGAHSAGGEPAPNPPGGTLAQPGVSMPNEQWRQGLFYIEELGYAGTTHVGYRQCDGDWGLAFPCSETASYHGRGAKQLSYNYNYGPFSRTVFGAEHMHVLLDAPERVASEGWLALSSAFYFYMTPRTPKPSIHETVTGVWLPTADDLTAGRDIGFGVTILIINGGLECGGATEVATAQNRRAYFEGLSGYFGLWTGRVETWAKHDCTHMQTFSGSGPSSYPPSWIENWDGSIALASWEEGPFSPLFPGDYYRAAQAAATSSHWDYEAGLGAAID